MGILNRERLSELLSVRSDYCLSMYFATPGAESGHGQDRVRLRELLLQAEDQVVAAGLDRGEARKLLQCAEELTSDDSFWAYSSEGLALFVALDWFRVFQVPQRFSDLVLVGSRFYVRPLLPLLHDDGRYYVLALTADDAHLYEATRDSIHEVALPVFAGVRPRGVGRPRRSLAVDGQSSGGEGQDPEADERRNIADLLRFFRQVDEAVRGVLDNLDAPLVLASVGYLASIYEAANSYWQLLREKVPGSPNIWSMDELREQAWQMAAPRFRKRREQAAAAFRELLGTERASMDMREIAEAAGEGRIATLFIERGPAAAPDGHFWRPSAATGVQLGPQNDSPFDFAVTRTLSYGGDVFDLDDIPSDAPLAAIFRY